MSAAIRFVFLLLLILALEPAPALAQEPAAAQERTDALRVFLDCNSCDQNYIRTEITFVNWVRDRQVADVHVLVTTQGTGGGGTLYTFKFIGLERFKGVEQTLTYTAPQTATDDERRRGYTAVMKLGLVRYAAETPLAGRLRVQFEAPPGLAKAAAVQDPWNFWVFRAGISGNLEKEESQEQLSLDASFSANRTTEAWKINMNGSTDYEREEFQLDEEDEEGGRFIAISRETEGRALIVKSLTNHWSFGGTFFAGASTFQNYDLRTRTAPGIEYNFYPYDESNRRILTLFYSIGFQTANYIEETIFGKTSEKLLDHSFEASIALRQPWGQASGSFEVQHYLNLSDKYRINAFGELDVRLFKGFELEIFGGGSRRRDQLSLRKGEATPEEILVRQRELATGFQLEFGFGISYSFGSVFNNIVNPRFRNVGGL